MHVDMQLLHLVLIYLFNINNYSFMKLNLADSSVLILLSILELCNFGNNIWVNLQQRKSI